MLDRIITVFYWLNVRTWVTLIMLFATRLKVVGLSNLPKTGPAILVSNHFNLGDPPVLTYVLPRRIVWMAKQELFDTPVVGWLFRAFGLIPVRRFEGDLKALRKAQNVLKRGHVLGMFPEGHRSDGKGLLVAEPGTAFIALRTGAPIVPVAIWGTEDKLFWGNVKRFRRNHIHLKAGPAFTLPPLPRENRDEALKQYTDEIMCRIAAMMPEKYHGVYAGHPRLKELLALQ